MSIEMTGTHKIIFLVEDNKADFRLIQEALKTSSLPHQVVTVPDGVEAMAYLHQECYRTSTIFRTIKSN